MDETELKLFNERLRAAYVASGMPVKEISFKSGVSKLNIDKWLSIAKPIQPKVIELAKVAKVLGVTVEWLVFGEATLVVPERLKGILQHLMMLPGDRVEDLEYILGAMSDRFQKKRELEGNAQAHSSF